MALEDRMKALEEELRVLKNQIHATLLEIQEQLLIHYYPALRGAESPPAESAGPARRSEKGNGHQAPQVETPFFEEDLHPSLAGEESSTLGTEASASPVSTSPTPTSSHPVHQREGKTLSPAKGGGQSAHAILPEEADELEGNEALEDASELPQLKQVSLDQIRQRIAAKGDEIQSASRSPGKTETSLEIPAAAVGPCSPQVEKVRENLKNDVIPPEKKPSPPNEATTELLKSLLSQPQGQLAPESNGKVAWTAFAALMEWVGDSVESIGADRTRQATEIYARGGYLAPEIKDVIFQLISLSNDQEPQGEVGTKEIVDTLLRLNGVLVQATSAKTLKAHIKEASFG